MARGAVSTLQRLPGSEHGLPACLLAAYLPAGSEPATLRSVLDTNRVIST